ncbi:hypothetical protein QUW56_03255 [Phocaeicola barnesiae]|uniref:hypothetical protein n=1 Tax=Phocaeicola barnesiae TaxID=376804 RepID=UPI0025A442DA|nr:hypothetical protein [Phocaeicola barnesiae]MDM8232411.1 hypothetical protein [Phocaeicola barnesiae]
MEELDIEILNDMQEQMDQCTRLAIKYTSLLTSNSVDIPNTVNSPECQQILKKLLSILIIENNASSVLGFICVPIKFVMDKEKADMAIEETRKALDYIKLNWQDRLLNVIFDKTNHTGY